VGSGSCAISNLIRELIGQTPIPMLFIYSSSWAVPPQGSTTATKSSFSTRLLI